MCRLHERQYGKPHETVQRPALQHQRKCLSDMCLCGRIRCAAQAKASDMESVFVRSHASRFERQTEKIQIP